MAFRNSLAQRFVGTVLTLASTNATMETTWMEMGVIQNARGKVVFLGTLRLMAAVTLFT